MKTVIFPGSFDPFTLGHLDIVTRAAQLFDRVVVAVATAGQKNFAFTPQQRVELIEKATAGIAFVEVTTFDGLLVNFARTLSAQAILRGLRDETDYAYERSMAQMNSALAPEIETVFLLAKPEHMFVSSTRVKEIAKLGGELQTLVPPSIQGDVVRTLQALAQ